MDMDAEGQQNVRSFSGSGEGVRPGEKGPLKQHKVVAKS